MKARGSMVGLATVVALAASGCGRVFGLDPPNLRQVDASIMADAQIIDGRIPTDASPITVTFRQGVDGYAAAADTYLEVGLPNANNGGDNSLRWRFEAGAERWGLLKFDGIIGTIGPPGNAITAGSTIVDATLEVEINANNAGGAFHDVLIAWNEAVTYATFGFTGGVDASEVGPLVAVAPMVQGIQIVNVRDSVARWAAAPASNFGWIIVPTSGTSDSSMRTSNDGVLTHRPRLSVTYIPPSP